MRSIAATPIAATARIRRPSGASPSSATVGFLITWAVMHLLVDRWLLPYLPAQVLTTGLVMLWSFSAHKWWTFRERGKG